MVSLKMSTYPKSHASSAASIAGWYMAMPMLKVLSYLTVFALNRWWSEKWVQSVE